MMLRNYLIKALYIKTTFFIIIYCINFCSFFRLNNFLHEEIQLAFNPTQKMKATHNSVNFLSPTSSNYLHFGYLLQVLADLLRYQDPGKAILQISCICRKGRWDNIHNITDQHHCVHSWKIWRATLIRPNLETNYHGSNPGGQVGLIIYQILMSNLTFNFTILHSIMYT